MIWSRGFSLVELAVALATIALLGAARRARDSRLEQALFLLGVPCFFRRHQLESFRLRSHADPAAVLIRPLLARNASREHPQRKRPLGHCCGFGVAGSDHLPRQERVRRLYPQRRSETCRSGGGG